MSPCESGIVISELSREAINLFSEHVFFFIVNTGVVDGSSAFFAGRWAAQ
jgi:hypothetical protein